MANALTTIDMVKDAAHIPPINAKWDEVLTDWITVASDIYERQYQQSLNAVNLTETYFDISSGQLLALRHVPLLSITSITTYDTEDPSTVGVVLVAGSDYRLQDGPSGLIKFQKLGSFIPVGLMEAMALTPTIWAKVIIVYASGFTTVPMTLQRAGAELIAHWFDQYGRNQSLESLSVGDLKETFSDMTKWPMPILEMFAMYDTSADSLVGII